MARHEYGSDAIVTQAPRNDGAVHFRVKSAARPISERLCQWGLASLWFLVAAVIVATAVS